MKRTVTIQTNEQLLYQGKAYDLPIKPLIMKEFSMRMFGDPDPCLIHQSLVTQRLVDYWLKELGSPITRAPLSDESYFIDLPLAGAVCSIEVR